MIHAYLFATNQPSNHGKQFKQIMKDINDLTGAKITITHHFSQNVPVYFYRCTGHCRYQAPDFGWIKSDRPRAPNPTWQGHRKKCDGYFVQVYDTFKARNNDVLAEQVNNNRSDATNSNAELNFQSTFDTSMAIKQEISYETGGELYEIDLITDLDAPITDEMFANYHKGQRKLLSVDFLKIEPASTRDKDFCIICQQFVMDEQIHQHLFECTGLSAEQIQYHLPMYRIPSDNKIF